jgi:hypothetical protein
VAASALLATCLSLNTLQSSRVQAAELPSVSTVVLVASSPASPAQGPYQAKLDDVVNRLGRLEFRMDESDKSKKREAAEAEKRADAKEKRSDAKMAAMEKRSDDKMAAMELLRKQEAAEAEKRSDAKMAAMEKRSDAKMAAMEVERKKGEDRNFFVSAFSAVSSFVSAFSAAAANDISRQKAPDPQRKP